jgi:hypothetical protein
MTNAVVRTKALNRTGCFPARGTPLSRLTAKAGLHGPRRFSEVNNTQRFQDI